MKYISRSLSSFLQIQKTQTERGATLLEYCFILLLIMFVCIVGVTGIGSATNDKLGDPELVTAFGG